MKFLKTLVLFFALSGSLLTRAQHADIFITLQTGTPFRLIVDEGSPPMGNFNIGVEQYIIDRLSMALSYRKPFYIMGKELSSIDNVLYEYGGYYYTFSEYYDSYAIDFESKFFFEEPDDDGWFMTSSLSFQHLTMNVEITSVYPVNSSSNPGAPVLHEGKFTDEMNIYPFTIKVGHRTSGDVLVFDYFIGITHNFGATGIKRKNEQYLDYYSFKPFSFPLGLSLGFKF